MWHRRDRGDEKWPWEDGSGPGGVKGEKARQRCAEAECLVWGGVELTEATSRDSSLSIKELRRRGRACHGFPIPTEHPHAAPPTLNTFSQSLKSLPCCHESPGSLAMHDQSSAWADKHQQSLALITWQTRPGASFIHSLQRLKSHVTQLPHFVITSHCREHQIRCEPQKKSRAILCSPKFVLMVEAENLQ